MFGITCNESTNKHNPKSDEIHFFIFRHIEFESCLIDAIYLKNDILISITKCWPKWIGCVGSTSTMQNDRPFRWSQTWTHRIPFRIGRNWHLFIAIIVRTLFPISNRTKLDLKTPKKWNVNNKICAQIAHLLVSS